MKKLIKPAGHILIVKEKENSDEFNLNLRSYIREEDSRRIFAKVFDQRTISAVHKLAMRGLFKTLEFVVSTGKEAHVFRAVDSAGNFRAVKIYKIETSAFRHMGEYITGDERFKKIGREKQDVVYAWTRKEFKNLERASEAGVRVPMPMGFRDNVLVMEFIGREGVAAKTLKDAGFQDMEKLYQTVVDWVARLYFGAGLVHADMSEYNILVNGEEAVLIDMGQAVLLTHPKAREFFERDVGNIAEYFAKAGLKTDFGRVYGDIKAKKEPYGKRG